MQVIQNAIQSYQADSESSSWPAANLEDDHPRNVWKSSDSNDQTAYIRLTVKNEAPYVSAVYLGNTSAQTGTLRVYTDSSKTVQIGSDYTLSFIGQSYFTFLTRDYLETFVSVWQDITGVTGAYTSVYIEIELHTTRITDLAIVSGGSGYDAQGTLTASGGGGDGFAGFYTSSGGVIDNVRIQDGGTGYTSPGSVTITPSGSGTGASITPYSIIKAGIARAGAAREFPNPDYGMQEAFQDFSIYKRFRGGAEYTKPRDIVRVFEGSIMNPIADASLFQSLMRQSRHFPMAWKLLSDPDEERGVVFGKAKALPVGTRTHSSYLHTRFQIEEVY